MSSKIHIWKFNCPSESKHEGRIFEMQSSYENRVLLSGMSGLNKGLKELAGSVLSIELHHVSRAINYCVGTWKQTSPDTDSGGISAPRILRSNFYYEVTQSQVCCFGITTQLKQNRRYNCFSNYLLKYSGPISSDFQLESWRMCSFKLSTILFNKPLPLSNQHL